MEAGGKIMAKYAGDIVLYKTRAGIVPAVTTAHYSDATTLVNDIVANATHADLTLLNAAATKLVAVPKTGDAVTFASSGSAAAVDNGEWFIAA